MNTALWVVLVLAVIGWLWYKGSRPAIHPVTGPEDISRAVKVLLARGVNGATLVIRLADDHDRAVEVVKYVRGEQRFGARLVVLAASPQRIEALKRELSSRAIRFDESGTDGGLTVDFGKDRGGAAVTIWIAVQQLLSATPTTDCEFFLRRVLVANAPHLTGVDSAEEPWF